MSNTKGDPHHYQYDDRFKVSKTDGSRRTLPPSTMLPEPARTILQEAARVENEAERVRAVNAAHKRVRELFPEYFNQEKE